MLYALRVGVVTVLAAWLIGTVIIQFDYGWAQRFSVGDIFHVLPRWTFFAPNPGTSDYHLVFRQRNADGMVSDFLEIPLHERNPWMLIWNPQKRLKKALLDLAIMLKRLCDDGYDDGSIQLTFPYLSILNFVSKCTVASDTVAIQFCLFESSGFDDTPSPRMIISSEFHSV